MTRLYLHSRSMAVSTGVAFGVGPLHRRLGDGWWPSFQPLVKCAYILHVEINKTSHSIASGQINGCRSFNSQYKYFPFVIFVFLAGSE